MLYQVMISGTVKRDVEISLNDERIQYVLHAASVSNITGLTAYTDGSYLSLIEGDKRDIDKSIEAQERDNLLASVMVMISHPIEKRLFPDYSFGMRYEDAVGSFTNIEQCFRLTPTSLNEKIPESLPPVFQTLFRTFSQVNQLRSA